MIYDTGALSNALMFDHAYKILNERLQQGAKVGNMKDAGLIVPVAVNCAFSCELLLKSMLPIGTKGHKLYNDLFLKLDTTLANNIKKIVFETQKLDQIAPEISYGVTNKDGILDLSITYTDDNSGLAGYQITDEAGVIQRIITEPTEWINISGKVFTTTYEIKENKIYYLWVKDMAGNIKYITYSSTDVDTLAPTLTISNSLTTWGLKDSIHLIATDNLAGINAYSISKNENEYNWQPITNTLRYETEIEVTENNTYYISVKDAYNHITTESIIIEKIDVNSPVIDQVILNKNVDSIIAEVVATDQESDIQKIYYQIDDEDEVVSDILTHTFEKLSEGTHTVTVIVEDNVGNKSSKSSTLEIFYNKKIEILAFNGTIENGKTLKNYIKNGSYESDLYEWEVPYQKPEISNNSYSGSNSLKFPASTGTIMTKQKLDISHPELNHTYYGSIMVNSNEGYKVSDGRYEFFYTDGPDALLVYAHKNKDTKGQWLKMSSIQTSLGDSYYDKEWIIRNFIVRSSQDLYVDDLIMVDLTETFGENLPTKDWLDNNLDYFEETAGFYTDIIKENDTLSLNVDSMDGYNYDNVICDNASVSYEEGKINPTADTVCKIKFVEETVNLVVFAENATIKNGINLKNLIQNGGFENGTTGWQTSNSKVTTTKVYEGNKAIAFQPSGISMSSQKITTEPAPILNHQYYGRIMYYSSNSFELTDNRFEWWSGDQSQNDSLIVFGRKYATNNTWIRQSSIKTVTTNTYLKNTWQIRNFTVDANEESYADNVMLLNLTTAYGAGNEPSVDWLDNYIPFFEANASVISKKVGQAIPSQIEIALNSGHIVASLECNNADADYYAGYLKISNKTDNVYCILKTSNTTAPTISFEKSIATSGTNGWYTELTIKTTLKDEGNGVKAAKYCVTTENSCIPNLNANIESNAFNVTFNNSSVAQVLCVNATDNANNTSETMCTMNRYPVDNEKPIANMSLTTKESNITIDASSSVDNYSGIGTYYYSKDGINYYSSTSSIYTFTGLSDGEHSIYLKVVDEAGNTSEVKKETIVVSNTLYLFKDGTFTGTYATWAGKNDAVDYISISNNKIHFEDASSSAYGNSLLGFDMPIDLTNYNIVRVEYTVNSIANATTSYPFGVGIYVVDSNDYYHEVYHSALDSSCKTVVVSSLTTTGTYTLDVNIAALSGTHNLYLWIMSHQYKNGLLNVDVSSISLLK